MAHLSWCFGVGRVSTARRTQTYPRHGGSERPTTKFAVRFRRIGPPSSHGVRPEVSTTPGGVTPGGGEAEPQLVHHGQREGAGGSAPDSATLTQRSRSQGSASWPGTLRTRS